ARAVVFAYGGHGSRGGGPDAGPAGTETQSRAAPGSRGMLGASWPPWGCGPGCPVPARGWLLVRSAGVVPPSPAASGFTTRDRPHENPHEDPHEWTGLPPVVVMASACADRMTPRWTRRAGCLQAAASPLLVCRVGCWRCWLECPGLRRLW